MLRMFSSRALALAGVLAALDAIALLPQALIKIAAEQRMLPLMGTSAVYWSFVAVSATRLLSSRNHAKLRRARSRVVRRVAVTVSFGQASKMSRQLLPVL